MTSIKALGLKGHNVAEMGLHSNPMAPTFVTDFNNRGASGSTLTGDCGPERELFIAASKSPNGKPLLIVGNEASGATAVSRLNLAV